MTQNLAHTWLLVTWIILTSGKRFLSPVYLSAAIGSSRTSLPTMIIGVGLMAGASAGPLRRGVCGSNDVCDVVPNGSAHRFRSKAQGRPTLSCP